jgi:hypothetical protein
MFERKQVAKFIVLVLIIYTLLAVPWPGVRQAYSAAYRVTADSVLGVSTSNFLVYVRPLREDEGEGDEDVKLGVWDRQVQRGQRVRLSTRLTGYLPTAELLALVLATSLPWSRKWKALLWGLIGVHAFIALRLASGALYVLSMAKPTPFFEFAPLGNKVVYSIYEMAVQSPTTSFFVPALIWILVSFRKSDFEGWGEQGRNERKKYRRQRTSSGSAAGLLS